MTTRCWSNRPPVIYLLKEPYLLHFTILSLLGLYVTLDIVFPSAAPPCIGGSLVYNVLLLYWDPHAACWLLVISRHQTSMGLSKCVQYVSYSVLPHYLQLLWALFLSISYVCRDFAENNLISLFMKKCLYVISDLILDDSVLDGEK